MQDSARGCQNRKLRAATRVGHGRAHKAWEKSGLQGYPILFCPSSDVIEAILFVLCILLIREQ